MFKPGILFAYLAKSVVSSVVLVLAVVLALDYTGDFFYRFGRLSDSIPVAGIIAGILLETPFKLLEFMPSILLIGSVLGLSRLAGSSELVAMHAGGYSRVRAMGVVLAVGLLISVVSLLIHELYGPVAGARLQKIEAAGQSSRLLLAEDSSIWLKRANDFVQLGEIVSDQLITDITVYVFDNQFQLHLIRHAASAVEENGHWELLDVETSELQPNRVERTFQKTMNWEGFSLSRIIGVAISQPDNLSISSLRRYITELEKNELDTYVYRSALSHRYAFVVSALAMLALSFPLVVTNRKTHAIGQRVAIAILVAFIVYGLANALASAGNVYRFSPMLVALAPPAIMMLLALYVLRSQN